jgi:hypothetical protein
VSELSPDESDEEATQLAQLDADLAQLTTHLNTWLQDRFLSSDEAASLNLEDVLGLLAWLGQWHAHFDNYAGTEYPSVQARLAQIRTEIDNSIATFTDMSTTVAKPPED